MKKLMSVSTKRRMLGVIQEAFQSRIDLTAQLLGCTRKELLAIKRGEDTNLPTDEDMLFVFIQAKRFRKMNYKQPFYIFTFPVDKVTPLLFIMAKKEIPDSLLDVLWDVDRALYLERLESYSLIGN